MNTSNLNWDGMADAPYTQGFGRLDHPFVGDTLPNGATVIAHHHGDNGEGIVLAYVLKGMNGHEYVTWRYFLENGVDGYQPVTLQGNYFSNIMRATRDFGRRIGADTE